jgi:hypothetical protein
VEGVEILDNSSIRIKHVASLKDAHAARGGMHECRDPRD